MKRLLLVGLLSTLTACSIGREPDLPLTVGPGPCGDTSGIDVSDPSYVEEGCQAVLLVEATRDARTAPITVEGRALTAGSLRPVPGASVLVLGQNRGTSTDRWGQFTLDGLDPRDRLVVAAGWYVSDTLRVGSLPGPRARLPR